MEVAKISVTENRALVLNKKAITSGMVGATVAFGFDENWDSLRKTYVWKANDVTLDDTDATGKVPHELLIPGAQLKVGVYGVSEEKTIPTLWADLGMVVPGADPSGDESTNPSLPVWAQIQKQMDDLAAKEEVTGVLKDRVTGANYTLYVDGGDLWMEQGGENGAPSLYLEDRTTGTVQTLYVSDGELIME